MSLNGYGKLWTPADVIGGGLAQSVNNTDINATGESMFGIGDIILVDSNGDPVSSATFDTSGKIHYRTAGVTFANAASTYRFGLQDQAATGLEDTTFDVSADLVGGTDTINANALNAVTMESGSKVLSYGQRICIGVEAISRGGADSVAIVRGSVSTAFPYCTLDTGSGPAKASVAPIFTLEFGNGVIGFLSLDSFAWPVLEQSSQFNSGSTPDEAALIFRLPFLADAMGLMVSLGNLAATDDFEVHLYRDPLGTPSVIETIAQDMDLSGTGQAWERPLTATRRLNPNEYYAVALRPTTANNLSYPRFNLGSGKSILRRPMLFGEHMLLGTRSNQTDAFATDDTIIPFFGVRLMNVASVGEAGYQMGVM